jgi:hypothetical protein
MTYYIVKVSLKATQSNPNFAGVVSIAYYGKDQKLLKMEEEETDTIKVSPYMVKTYGYKRKCDAIRAYVYKNCESTQYWNKQAEIIEVEVD